jgi:hypothetical protein
VRERERESEFADPGTESVSTVSLLLVQFLYHFLYKYKQVRRVVDEALILLFIHKYLYKVIHNIHLTPLHLIRRLLLHGI